VTLQVRIRLYHRNRDPLHLVLDEADALAPQRTDPGGQRLLGAIEDLVRRGRARGIGLSMISQSPVDCTLGLSE
jgi:DNA helicase HerA-like ATPase